jgi:PAS domain S-box-containing protein
MAKIMKSDKDELLSIRMELALQKEGEKKLKAELTSAHKKLAFLAKEKGKRAAELGIANKELVFQGKEKGKRAAELDIANIELAFQDLEKGKRAAELIIANKELVFQKKEKGKRAAELNIANIELAFQDLEKGKRATELIIANKELIFQNKEKEKRKIENKELEAFSNSVKLASQYSLSLIEASLDPLVTISIEGKITDMNEATVNITGITREKLTGTDFLDYFTEPQKAREVYQEVFSNGSVTDSPLTLRHKNGKLTDVLFNGSVYKDDRGNVIGIVIVARDVTEKKIFDDMLRESENSFRKLVENLPIAVYTCDVAGYLSLYNIEATKLWGRVPVIGKDKWSGSASLFQLDGKPIPLENCPMAIALKSGVLMTGYELILERPDGVQRNVKQYPTLLYDSAGIISGAVNMVEDITESKQAVQYNRSLIEASIDPMVTISTEGKILDVNEALTVITLAKREQLIGSDFKNYFAEPKEARKVYKQIFDKGFVENYPLTIIDGELTPVLLTGSVYKDTRGNVLGAVVTARVITEQKRFEKELTEAKTFAELATGIAEIAKEKAEKATILAEDATRIAEDAVKSKQQFLSNMSHEIRTPMNAIIGFTKVVLKTELSAKQKEYLTAIKMSGDSLIVLINDILDLAKVDAGKMTFEHVPFKMALSISAMLHLFETKIQEKNLELVKEYDKRIPEVLIGDPVRLHQIILNLVSNAVKFTSIGKITVGVHLVKEDEEKVIIEFTVTDTGIGIPESKISKIFENFQQASSGTSRLYGGTGLGLAIVKQLVEPQGGRINVTSKLNEGSTFSFILSFLKTREEAQSETEIVELDSEIKNIKVLVVEDIALNQLLMKTLLDDFGFERDIASNGKIAIEKLQAKTYDIILMDLQMPEMNGFEATEYIRNTLNSKIPIIALTADVTTVDLAKCKEVGMNDYIAKPVDERLLYSKIVGLVKKPSLVKMEPENNMEKRSKCIDLDYLIHRTKSNPKLMMEMISLYLEQTPPLILIMKQSLRDKDWHALYSAVHKMIPSFSIMGISIDFENMAKKVQEYASTQQQTDGIPDLVMQLENICSQACKELEIEFDIIKNTPK